MHLMTMCCKYCLHKTRDSDSLLGSVVIRLQALEKCRQGGFIDASAALKSDAYVALRSPSAAPSCSVLRHVFFLAKSFCDLWTFKDRLAPAYVKALDMLEIEKTNVLGVSGQAASNSRCSSEGQSIEPKLQDTYLFYNWCF